MTEDRQKVLQGIKQILVEDLDLNLEIGEISDDASLMEDGLGLDSVVVVELITHLEKRFGFHFDDDSLTAENFESLGTLASFVMQEQAAAAELA